MKSKTELQWRKSIIDLIGKDKKLNAFVFDLITIEKDTNLGLWLRNSNYSHEEFDKLVHATIEALTTALYFIDHPSYHFMKNELSSEEERLIRDLRSLINRVEEKRDMLTDAALGKKFNKKEKSDKKNPTKKKGGKKLGRKIDNEKVSRAKTIIEREQPKKQYTSSSRALAKFLTDKSATGDSFTKDWVNTHLKVFIKK